MLSLQSRRSELGANFTRSSSNALSAPFLYERSFSARCDSIAAFEGALAGRVQSQVGGAGSRERGTAFRRSSRWDPDQERVPSQKLRTGSRIQPV